MPLQGLRDQRVAELLLALLLLALEVIRYEVRHYLLLHLSVPTHWLPTLTLVHAGFSPQRRNLDRSHS